MKIAYQLKNKVSKFIIFFLIIATIPSYITLGFGYNTDNQYEDNVTKSIITLGLSIDKKSKNRAIEEAILINNINKLGIINEKALGDPGDFLDWVESKGIDKGIIYITEDDAHGNLVVSLASLMIDIYYPNEFKAVQDGTLTFEVDDSQQIVCDCDSTGHVYTSFAVGMCEEAWYTSYWWEGSPRSWFLETLANKGVIDVYPSFLYDDSVDKVRDMHKDIVYTLYRMGIYNTLDISSSDKIYNLEALLVSYMIDTGKTNKLPDITTKLNECYHGVEVDIQTDKGVWKVRNELVYCLDSIPSKWIMSFKDDNWKFVIVDDVKFKLDDGADAIAICSTSDNTIYIGTKRFGFGLYIPEHELAHYIADKGNIYGSASTLMCLEAENLGTYIGDYALTNHNEYFAECFKHIWANRNNREELDKIQAKIPLTFHVIYDLVINSNSDYIIDGEAIRDFVADWYIENIGI